MSQGQGPKSKDMRLKIIGCRHVYSGRNQRGDNYSIYEIDAERAQDGVRINQKLRAFTALPIGQTVDVTVTPFVSERHGKSFTLEPKNRTGGGGGTQRVNELSEQVEELTRRVATMSKRLSEVETRLGEVMRDDASVAPTRVEAATATELDDRFGADSPW